MFGSYVAKSKSYLLPVIWFNPFGRFLLGPGVKPIADRIQFSGQPILRTFGATSGVDLKHRSRLRSNINAVEHLCGVSTALQASISSVLVGRRFLKSQTLRAT